MVKMESPNRKGKIKIFIAHPSRKELEEISAVAPGGVEGADGSPWINFKPGKREKEDDEEFINEVLNYLVKVQENKHANW